MAAYLRMLLNRGRGLGGRILSKESFALLTSKAIKNGPNSYYGYALDIEEVDGRTRIGHGGGHLSFKLQILADMDAGVGAVVLLNRQGLAGRLARFTVGEENAAEDIRFGALAGSVALTARFGGGDYYRTLTPSSAANPPSPRLRRAGPHSAFGRYKRDTGHLVVARP